MYSSDEKLVSQTLAGDRDAFGLLVRKYQGMVYTYAFQKVRNEADSQDISQEVFLRAYRHLYQLRHPHRFRSWLYTIMANECNRWLSRVSKKHQREIALEDAADDALHVEPAHTVPTEGWEIDLEQAISALSDDNRVAVSMFYMGDCSLNEISEFLGVSANTVKGKLYRARQQLGSAMSERYGRYLKSHTLKGGFLMQLTEQIRRIPTPAMTFTWSSTAVSKTLFSLITALCVLIGLIGGRILTSPELSGNQSWPPQSDTSRWPIKVAFYTPDQYTTHTSVSGIPAPSGKHALAAANRAPTRQSSQSNDNKLISANRGGKNAVPQLAATAAGKEREKLNYSGRVVDGGGAAVADAEVYYSISLKPSKSVTRTGTDGTFRFEFLRPEPKKWDRVDIIAMHPSHAIGWQNLAPQSTADVEIQLGIPGSISGTIMNEAGEPIENAEARIQYLVTVDLTSGEGAVGLGIDAMPISTAKTNADGEFVLRGLPQGATTNLVTQGPGYAMELHFSVAVGTMGLEFRLKREGRVEGNLGFAGTGEPVNNAVVMVEGIHPTEGWGRTNTDSNGNYLLKNIPPGTYNLFLHEGPEGWTAVAKEHLKVVEGLTVWANLTLVKGGFITGRVTDRDTDEPMANHHISFHDSARPQSQVSVHGTHTDETGAYRFRAAPGRAMVYTSAPEGYQQIGQIKKNVTVVEDETVTVDFQFSKGVDLVGRVMTQTGNPVSGARIYDNSNVRELFKEYGKSDEQGEFTVRGLLIGQNLVLRAEHNGLGLRGTAKVEVQPGASVDITMERYDRVAVSGRVVNRAGEPIPSVNINLEHWDHQLNSGFESTAAVTDGEGRFHDIALIIGDEYDISANAEGYRRAETESFTATAEMTQIPNLVLTPATGDSYFIEGRITDTAGEPVRGARAYITQPQLWESVTDENGEYRFENLSTAVVLELDIDHPDYAHHEFKSLKSNQRHDLMLVKADGFLYGKIVDADGKPIDQAFVGVEAAENEEYLSSGYAYSDVSTNVLGEFELKYIKDPVVSLYATNGTDHKIFKDIAVNQRDLVLTLTPTEPRPEPTAAQQVRRKAHRSYVESVEERFKTLVNQPAPELAVAEWLSGPHNSIADLEGKTIVLCFWDLSLVDDNVQWMRLLNLLLEVYGEKGLACLAICPASTAVEDIKRCVAEQSVTYSIGLDGPTQVVGAKGETFNRYAIGWGPPFILINSAGEIAGRAWADDLEIQIQTLLAD